MHPTTVTRHSQGHHLQLVEPPRPQRRPTHRVTTLTVHPDIWQHALAAADGHAPRIEVHDATHVTIHNTSDWAH